MRKQKPIPQKNLELEVILILQSARKALQPELMEIYFLIVWPWPVVCGTHIRPKFSNDVFVHQKWSS